MDDYDHASRSTAKLDPPGFFRWPLGEDVTVSFHDWLDSRTLPAPGERNRISDSVAHLHDPASPTQPIALVTDFQTENDPEILERLLEYLARTRRELRRRKFRVLGALVNLTGAVQTDRLEMTLPGRPKHGLRLWVVLKTLREEDAGQTLDSVAEGRWSRCLLPWVPLMRGGSKSAIMKRWKRLAQKEPKRDVRTTLGLLALTFAKLTRHFAAWRKLLEDWEVKIAPLYEEARQEGRLLNQRDALPRALERRFKAPVPADLSKAVQESTDLGELSRWFDVVFDVPTLEAFRAAINR